MDSVSKTYLSPLPGRVELELEAHSSPSFFVRPTALILFGTARTLPEAIVCRLLQGTANGAIGVVSLRGETPFDEEKKVGRS